MSNMKSVIKKLYKETYIGKLLISPIKGLYDWYRFKIIPDDVYIKKVFEKNLGYKLNLQNPVTLNEKIQWLKLNDRTKLHTKCADKYAVREYVKEKIGEQYLIPLLYQTENHKDITDINMPDEPFIIKTNHDSGGVVIVKDKSSINWKQVQKELSLSMKNNYYYPGREWQYKNIKPSIVVEKLLLDENNKIPNDYKLHCFNGKSKVIQVDMSRFEKHRRNLYDNNWNLLECEWLCSNGKDISKPKNIDKMIKLAEILAKDFTYVRVDLYSVKEKIYFGELTFHTESGWGKFSSKECDKKFGELLSLESFFT